MLTYSFKMITPENHLKTPWLSGSQLKQEGDQRLQPAADQPVARLKSSLPAMG
jgi:hypothetical protein